MKYKYNDSDPLHTIEKGYNEPTRFLLFHSTPIEADRLQEALDIIFVYNDFDSKKVGSVLLEMFGKHYRFVVGREYSPVIYVICKEPVLWWPEDLIKLQTRGVIDEVAVDGMGRLRLWWD